MTFVTGYRGNERTCSANGGHCGQVRVESGVCPVLFGSARPCEHCRYAVVQGQSETEEFLSLLEYLNVSAPDFVSAFKCCFCLLCLPECVPNVSLAFFGFICG